MHALSVIDELAVLVHADVMPGVRVMNELGTLVLGERGVDGAQEAPKSGEERGHPQISSPNFSAKFVHRRRGGVVR
jgi:hypothetical protein